MLRLKPLPSLPNCSAINICHEPKLLIGGTGGHLGSSARVYRSNVIVIDDVALFGCAPGDRRAGRSGKHCASRAPLKDYVAVDRLGFPEEFAIAHTARVLFDICQKRA